MLNTGLYVVTGGAWPGVLLLLPGVTLGVVTGTNGLPDPNTTGRDGDGVCLGVVFGNVDGRVLNDDVGLLVGCEGDGLLVDITLV